MRRLRSESSSYSSCQSLGPFDCMTCPEYKVTAVQVMPSNGPSEWQQSQVELGQRSRRIASDEAMEPAE